ncbi:hypothetical protein TPHA_0F00230 [Tetrapisispora phaffii CBS 4417]|uniref:ENTH domain-containing protein n=1 Tax=Tetrapisispora phaffii (strain ATCC 24235 / CBS 4417 / NBRC 1672 / NRRL Y-8282 / UCD 70-5) TaxID=1071381 RepID=G8BUS8_TETPH|nr:hypothetical protein TPHA_0F00230 [Tetrapisispora phaffii CBS 4417]CCE63510.1 hypothetical protein TPHA_0F00230 [Tetrapisispora phaffii CBS 4417]
MPLFDSVRNFVQSPTESKVRQATDDDETSGATGTLMNEISVLTYSPKTLKEIVQILKKRLTGYSKKNSHKNCVHILKTLTLITYLINNGSNDFIAWTRSNIMLFEYLKNFEVQNLEDEKMGQQIVFICNDICNIINDDDMLEQKRKDVVQFRSSISFPGRKSTDNSHIKTNSSATRGRTGFSLRDRFDERINQKEKQIDSTSETVNEYQFVSNSSSTFRGGTTSLDLKRRSETLRRNNINTTNSDLWALPEEDSLRPDHLLEKENQLEYNTSLSYNNPFD